MKIAFLYLGTIATTEPIAALVNPLGGIVSRIVLCLGLVSHISFHCHKSSVNHAIEKSSHKG